MPVKNILVAIILTVTAGLIVSSCAALDMFKGSAGNSDTPRTSVKTDQSLSESNSDTGSEKTMDQLETKVARLEDKVSSLEGQVASQKKDRLHHGVLGSGGAL